MTRSAKQQSRLSGILRPVGVLARRTAGDRLAVLGFVTAAGLAAGLTAASALNATTALTPVPPRTQPPLAAPGIPSSFADLVERVAPAVVNVRVDGTTAPAQPDSSAQGDARERALPPGVHGLGSGFIVDRDGYIVTNNHVVAAAGKITVTLADGTDHDATLVGRDEKSDLALVKIAAGRALPFVQFGDSDAMRVGDWVVAVGSPFGLGGTVTTGILSATDRVIGAGPYDDFLQIDAPINQGNSGGPAFNTRGEVIGVNTAIFSPSGGSVGIGFAIPSSQAKRVIAELREDGKVDRGWLGVRIQPVSPDVAEALGLPKPEGALVSSVDPDSPAAAAGVEQGDVILGFAGNAVASVRDLPRLVADTTAGSDAEVKVWRQGEEIALSARIAALPDSTVRAAAEIPMPVRPTVLGMRLGSREEAEAARLQVAKGPGEVVVLDIDENSIAARKGLRPGDVIVSVSQQSVSDPEEVARHVAEAKERKRDAVLLLVNRDDDERFVALALRDA